GALPVVIELTSHVGSKLRVGTVEPRKCGPYRTLAVPSPMARVLCLGAVEKERGRPLPLLAHAPVALKRLADLVAGGIGHDQLRTGVLAVDDGVLPEGAAETDGFFAIDAVDHPGRLTPDTLGFFLEAD